MITSGVRRPSSVCVDSLKSKWMPSSRPALSRMRRSWISPHWPRVFGERSARASLLVSECRTCWDCVSERSCSDSCACELARPRSTSFSLVSTFVSDSRSGWTSEIDRLLPSLEVHRRASSEIHRATSARVGGRTRCSRLSASDDSAENASRSLLSASWRRAIFSAPLPPFGIEGGGERGLFLQRRLVRGPRSRRSPRARRRLRQAQATGPADTGFPRGRSLGERSANLKICMMKSPTSAGLPVTCSPNSRNPNSSGSAAI